jgi:acyl transferase domain-containing protein/NAD(P)-dependent dehydrogenase (short-subunit alcohol dehydrogenase family)
LAVQHGQIPANLHFGELNPNIRPFYSHLKVPTQTTPWPFIPKGVPRRVSINSFGFGGTNAHAIIESLDEALSRNDLCATKSHCGGLFVLSANSAQALARRARALETYLRDHPDTDLDRLSHTLYRRSSLPYRAAFSATSARQLANKLDASKRTLQTVKRATIIPEALPPRILAIFTGQGAQWATMGSDLYKVSDVFRSAIDQMQSSLDSLPDSDRPVWTLVDELCAPAKTTRVDNASISQPLCTALQIALVNALRAAGVKLSAVVGHSSGEIAAAYAAGYLNAQDSIRIAYYRGFHSHLAQGPQGKRGKMMAVGMSMDQASRLCSDFEGRLKVAASNSQRSCTLSGDIEAIEQAQSRLQENGVFVRVLKIDTAYHSHHMQPCSLPYLESLRRCDLKVQRPLKDCLWYSSVWGSNGRSRSFDESNDTDLLKGQYWVDNLTQTVLFSGALNRAVSEEQPFDLVFEIGPHPALKGPSSETITAVTGVSLPYSGILKRDEGAIESFGNALGLIWTLFPLLRPMTNIRRAFVSNSTKRPTVLKGLPTYPWDHEHIIWHESRASRIFRTRGQSPHELLGHSTTYGDRQRREVHWRQVFKLSEIPWLRGHIIMDQCLFPATGYVTMAFEAAVRLAPEDQAVRLIELNDIEIHRPMILEEESTGLEVLFILRVTSHSDEHLAADFACYSHPVDASDIEEPLAPGSAQMTGSVRLLIGEPNEAALPPRLAPQLPLGEINVEAFYSSLADLGFGYHGDFQASAMMRRLSHAVVSIPQLVSPCLIRAHMHPAALDTAIHGIYASITSPGDGNLRSVYLPTRIDCVRVNMSAIPGSAKLAADAHVTEANDKSISGDIDIFNPENGQTEVQIQGVHMVVVPGSQRRAQQLYAEEVWKRDASCGIDATSKSSVSPERQEMAELATRMAFFHCRKLRTQVKPFELILMGKQQRNFMNWILKDLLPKVEAGEHQDVPKAWLSDTEEMLKDLQAKFSDTIDITLTGLFCQSLAPIVRGMAQPVKILTKNSMLDRLYAEGIGYQEANKDLGILVSQLSHRYPHMKILELGASGGATTRSVLGSISSQYASYTCTDVAFDSLPREILEEYPDRLIFGVLDIQKDPELQGHSDGTFDLIIASKSLYSVGTPSKALLNCRRLLRPGGYLILREMTQNYLPMSLVKTFVYGSELSNEGLSHMLDVEAWSTLLQDANFSGVDSSTSPSFCSVILSQAVNDVVQFLRNPLHASPSVSARMNQVLLVGDTESAIVTRLASQTQKLLATVMQTLDISIVNLEEIAVPSGASVVLLCDLDVPIFSNMDERRFLGLQEIVRNASTVLITTSGTTTGASPKANMVVGWGRSVRAEQPDLNLQFLNVDHAEAIDPSIIAAHLLLLSTRNLPELENVLWTNEPELKMTKGALYIPRILPLEHLDRRSNARTLEVTQSVALRHDAETEVTISGKGDVTCTQAHHDHNESFSERQICLQVSASSLHMFRFRDGLMTHIIIGRDTSSSQEVLALSSKNGSMVLVKETDILFRWAIDVIADVSVQLHIFLSALLAENVLDGSKGLTWIHDAASSLIPALDLVAAQHKIAIYRTCSKPESRNETSFLHPFLTERGLQSSLPKDIETFINFEQSQDHSLRRMVHSAFPNIDIRAFLPTSRPGVTLRISRAALKTLVENHVGKSSLAHNVCFEEIRGNIIGIDKVTPKAFEKPFSAMYVVDWTVAEAVNAKVLPPHHDGIFSSIKTYILFGLNGDVGVSICNWMVDCGARHVVLASRNPNIPKSVIAHMSQKKAIICGLTVDISDYDTLQAAFSELEATMPPIGGVMNGAAVWRDRLFLNMSWADFAAVSAPKVQGTDNLVRVLREKQLALDFFLLFSSVVAIAGNAGQTAYAAANLYMEGIVRQQRQRGLPASVVHIGHLAGLGHVHRHERKSDLEIALHQTMDAVSETSLHDALAEAIIGGRPESNRPAELIVGLKNGIQASWHQQPRLQRYLVSEEGEEEDVGQGANSHDSVKTQLSAAQEDQDACLSILVTQFSSAVAVMLYMKPDEVDASMSVANLGIDSLVGIRMREWFLKEVGVEVSVIKVLSVNTSLTELCRDVLATWRRLHYKAKA